MSETTKINAEAELAGKDIVLDAQQEHWQANFSQKPDMFGVTPSAPAAKAAERFERQGKHKILELAAVRDATPCYPASTLNRFRFKGNLLVAG